MRLRDLEVVALAGARAGFPARLAAGACDWAEDDEDDEAADSVDWRALAAAAALLGGIVVGQQRVLVSQVATSNASRVCPTKINSARNPSRDPLSDSSHHILYYNRVD